MGKRKQMDEEVLATFTAKEVLVALQRAYPGRIVVTSEHIVNDMNIYSRWDRNNLTVFVRP